MGKNVRDLITEYQDKQDAVVDLDDDNDDDDDVDEDEDGSEEEEEDGDEDSAGDDDDFLESQLHHLYLLLYFFLYFSFFDACFVFLLFQNLEFFLLCKENVKKSISPVFMIFLMFLFPKVSKNIFNVFLYYFCF